MTDDEIIILHPRGTDCDRTLGQKIFRTESVYEGIRSEFKTLIEKTTLLLEIIILMSLLPLA